MNITDFTGRAKPEYISPVLVSLLERLERGEKLSAAEKKDIMSRTNDYSGRYRLMGWEYDFRPFMSKYVVKMEHHLGECYAFNKQGARSRFVGCGRFIYAVEVPK